MSFIGILTDLKNETYTRNALKKDFSSQHDQVIFINHKNIQNIKNIRFESILLDAEDCIDVGILERIVMNSKNLIIHADNKSVMNKLNNTNLQVITFGFNPKSTVTISSVTEDCILMCIQRKIQSMSGEIIEPQEIKIDIKRNENIMANTVIGIQIVRLIYGKI